MWEKLLEKLSLVSIAAAAICMIAYMYWQRQFTITPDAVGVFVSLVIAFSAVDWLIRKVRK